MFPKLVVMLCVMTAATPAFASGLLVIENGQAKSLVPLSGLSVVADLNDMLATVDETRTYPWSPFESTQNIELRFVRSFTTTAGVVDSVTINGVPVDGQLHLGDESANLRRKWAHELGEATPLRTLAGGLWVSEPLDSSATEFWFGQFSIRVVSAEPLGAHGTMRGVSIPTDWHPQPVDWVDLKAVATSELVVRTLFAPYHPLVTTRTDLHTLTGTYSGQSRCTYFDVTILMSAGNEPIHLDLVGFRYNDLDEGHFMALIAPDPSPKSTDVAPRHLALVMDISGSMGGEKIAAAKAAIKGVLQGLSPQDSFSLTAFDDQIESFSVDAVPATPANIEKAIGFVDKQQPDGSTNIHDALKTALLKLPSSAANPRYVVFLTDGIPTAGETDVDAILNMATTYNEINARIFVFGIGSDVNTILLDKLAAGSNGDALYVLSAQGITKVVADFFAQITSPVLAHPVLTVDGVTTSTLYPEHLPDLFADQTITVLGRYTKGGPATIQLTGMSSDEKTTTEFEVVFPTFQMRDGFVPRIWAKRHVGTLLQEVKLGSEDPWFVEEATEVARRYGVITEFTYFELNELGDALMTYSAVPNSAVGEDAVLTSSSLDTYQKGGGVEGDSDSFVRYAFDRTFPRQGGYFRDTSMEENGEWIDLHFGSDAYWNLVDTEAELGVSGLMAIAPDVAFEFLGRNFRVTTVGENAPPESLTIPPPQNGVAVPDEARVLTSRVVVGGLPSTEAGSGDDGAIPQNHTPGAIPTNEGIGVGAEKKTEPLSFGCKASKHDGGAPLWPVLFVGMYAGMVYCRRRLRAGD